MGTIKYCSHPEQVVIPLLLLGIATTPHQYLVRQSVYRPVAIYLCGNLVPGVGGLSPSQAFEYPMQVNSGVTPGYQTL